MYGKCQCQKRIEKAVALIDVLSVFSISDSLHRPVECTHAGAFHKFVIIIAHRLRIEAHRYYLMYFLCSLTGTKYSSYGSLPISTFVTPAGLLKFTNSKFTASENAYKTKTRRLDQVSYPPLTFTNFHVHLPANGFSAVLVPFA